MFRLPIICLNFHKILQGLLYVVTLCWPFHIPTRIFSVLLCVFVLLLFTKQVTKNLFRCISKFVVVTLASELSECLASNVSKLIFGSGLFAKKILDPSRATPFDFTADIPKLLSKAGKTK